MTTIPIINAVDYDSDDLQAPKDVEGGFEDDFAYRNNVLGASKGIRLNFIRKVYGLLSLQLLITIVISAAFMFTPKIKEFIHQNDSPLLLVSFIASIGLLITLHIKSREFPLNLILLAAFTVVQAYMIGYIVTLYDQFVVIQAMFLTLAVVGGLTLYTFQSKRDYSSWYSGLAAGLVVLIVAGLLQIFFRSNVLELVISVGGALLFCFFVIFDTHQLMDALSPEDYIPATISLYLDIINLFLYILRILAAANRN